MSVSTRVGKASIPALAPALCLVFGTWCGALEPAGEAAGRLRIPLAALLVGLGWSWGRPPGRLLAWTVLGTLLAWARPAAVEDCLSRLDSSRPVTLLGARSSAWRSTDSGWRSTVTLRRARQGRMVAHCSARVDLTVAADSPPKDGRSARIKGFLKRYEPLRNGTSRHRVRPNRHGRWRVFLKSHRFWKVSETGRGSRLEAKSIGLRLRDWVDESFAGARARAGVGAARTLILGRRDALDAGLGRCLRRFGLSHLFAVSGLHVALIGMVTLWLLRGLRHRVRIVLTTLAVIAYLVLVGARPAIVRATAMALLAFSAVYSGRPPNSRQALCLAAGGLILVDPALIMKLSYQLTVAASAGILWLSPTLERRWEFLPRPLRRSLAVTVAAQLGSLPWTASAFSLIHPLAPVLNLIAIPWMVGFALCSFVGCALMKVVPSSRVWVPGALDLGIEPVVWLSNLPPSRWFAFPVALTFAEGSLLSAGLLAILVLRWGPLRWIAFGLVVVLLRGPSMSSVGELVTIDVGQGDAILLHDGSLAVLIDGGGWRTGDIAASVLIPTLARLGVRRLSAAVVSHPDNDHCRGLLDLSYYLPIGRVWSAPGSGRSPCVRELVSRPGTRWRRLWRGESLRVGRISLEVLHPGADFQGQGNASSLVIRAAVADRSVLLTGDVEAKGEERLLALQLEERVRSDILKLSHHGSRTSTTERFLTAVSPRVAVASAGRRNRYGHPAAEVLERCRRHRIRVVRTDRDGMIRLPLEPHVLRGGLRPPRWLRLWFDG